MRDMPGINTPRVQGMMFGRQLISGVVLMGLAHKFMLEGVILYYICNM